MIPDIRNMRALFIELLEANHLLKRSQIGHMVPRLLIHGEKNIPVLLACVQVKDTPKRFYIGFEFIDNKWTFYRGEW